LESKDRGERCGRGWKRLILSAIIPLTLLPLLGRSNNVWLIWLCGLVVGEFYFRNGPWASVISVLAPWIYLTIGLQTAFAYNTAIVSVRPFNLYDPFFRWLDGALFHISVANISHAASILYAPAEIVYYAMGGVMGAALIFLCLAGDRPRAFEMAGAILTAYYLSLLVFWAWPSNGPYSLDPGSLPTSTFTGAIQHASYANAAALYHHRAWLAPVYGYFVAFPSMHVAQPLLAGWFLRRWRRVSVLIFVYCGLLVAAILVLEWHYLVEIIGGILIAALSIALASISLGHLPFWLSKSRHIAPVPGNIVHQNAAATMPVLTIHSKDFAEQRNSAISRNS
jgi:hypothetical protein